MIRLENVVKTYRIGQTEVHALAGVSLDVARGDFVSVMGPSGSGKSTMLHLMGGLDVPESGEIVVGEQRLSELDDDAITLLRRRRIGFVFQFFNLLPTLSAEENVALPLLLDGQPARQAERRAAQALERVGLEGRRGHLPHALSGGEMQRVAVARALVVEPVVLLADEPTGNLDSKAGAEVLGLLKGASRDHAQTVVMVTHDPHAAAYGNRIVTLRDGVIVSDTCTTSSD